MNFTLAHELYHIDFELGLQGIVCIVDEGAWNESESERSPMSSPGIFLCRMQDLSSRCIA
jgi:hypothetical protein